jgi:hypothetical protein
MPTAVVRSWLASSGSRPAEASIPRQLAANLGIMLCSTRYEA